MFPWMFYPMMLAPKMPTDNDRPPTLYALLNSIVNYGKDEQTKIKDLTKAGRSKIFDFEYPLSNKVNKEDFEVMILNHFLMRRIGYETFTSWQIALNSKLNEIMPLYNKMLDSFVDWNLFNDGEDINRTTNTDNRDKTVGTNNVTTDSSNSSENVSDRRFSNLPENRISDVQDGDYLSEYNYDTDTNTSETSTTTNGTNETTSNGKQNISEHITRTPSDKITIYKEYLENLKSVYSMILKDLDCLFYQLV